MNRNNIYIFLIFLLLILSFTLSSGCGRYATQFSPVTIISRYPPIGTTGIGSGEAIWVKFSKAMDTSSFEVEYLSGKFITAEDMTATATFYPDPTPEALWSEDDTKLTLRNFFFIADPGNRVHYRASLEAFVESNDNSKIPENTELWDYTLSGVNITDRSPTIEATIINAEMTVEVTFNNPIAVYNIGVGPDHSAGNSTALENYLTNSNRTLVIHTTAFDTAPGVVDITAEVYDIYGNHSDNTQLWKFNIVP